MAEFDRNRARLTVSQGELQELVRLAVGSDDADHASPGLRAAGLIADDRVHPVAGAMAIVAVDPARAVAVERFDGTSMAPLFVGWDRDGRVTLTESGGDGLLAITATEMELLPSLLLQAVRLHPRVPAGDGGSITTTAAVVEQALGVPAAPSDDPVTEEPGDVAGSVGRPRVDDERLQALMDAFSHAWRATGSWQGHASDGTITVIDAGVRGLWLVEREDDEVEPIDADWSEVEVRLVPVTGERVRARLGDVVTGRTTPRPDDTVDDAAGSASAEATT